MDRHRAPLGIVGAGQLARMTCQAAVSLGIRPRLLAAHAADSAALVDPDVLVGPPDDLDALFALAAGCEVVTFDHELVDPEHLAALEVEGHVLRPGAATAALVVDKRRQRTLVTEVGLPQPRWRPVRAAGDVHDLALACGWPVVVKVARGGYDGRGVAVVDGPAQVTPLLAEWIGRETMVEEWVPIARELAVQVVRRPDGQVVVYPVAETVQVDGICREVLVPAPVDAEVAAAAVAAATALAEATGVVGVLAVELFLLGDGRLLVNELAARPHNSAHHSIDSCVTSQFENHLRAVLDLPLGDPSLRTPAAAMVNVLGPASGDDPADRLAAALAVPGARVHLYGKESRPGRKVGHVTVCGPDPASVRDLARRSVEALTHEPVPDSVVSAPVPGDGRPDEELHMDDQAHG